MTNQPHGSRLLRVDPNNPDRWWTRFVFWHCIVVLIWIGLGLILTHDVDHRYLARDRQPHPAASPPPPGSVPSSLGTFHHFIPIPWPAWGAVFLLLAAALIWRRTRPLAYFLAAILSIAFTVMVLIYTYVAGNSTNPIVVPLSTLAPDAFLAGFRYAVLPARAAHPRRLQP